MSLYGSSKAAVNLLTKAKQPAKLVANQFIPVEAEATMRHGQFVIRCPGMGSNVRVWLSDNASGDKPDAYEAVTCASRR